VTKHIEKESMQTSKIIKKETVEQLCEVGEVLYLILILKKPYFSIYY